MFKDHLIIFKKFGKSIGKKNPKQKTSDLYFNDI